VSDLAPFRGTLLSRQFARDMLERFAGRLGERSLSRAQRALHHWQRRVRATLGPASGLAALQDVAAAPLCSLLGFEVRPREASAEHAFVLSRLIAPGGHHHVPLVVGPWHARLDRVARRALQEAAALGSPWAIAFNGRTLRIVDADRPHARRYLEFDLERTLSDADDLRVLWAVGRAAALAPATTRPARAPGSAAAVRGMHEEVTLAQLADQSADNARRLGLALQLGVRSALEALATGLRDAAGPRTSSVDLVGQALTVLYRLLFLLFAEARGLVPVWQRVYRDGYTITGLSKVGEAPHDGGLWSALQAVSRLAHRGCATRLLTVTAFNSQLFSPEGTPLAEHARLTDETMRQVLHALTVSPAVEGTRAQPISYGDLGVEQLGSIYERVLDDAPDLERALEQPRRARESRTRCGVSPLHGAPRPRRVLVSARRKESGTFYTPRGMAAYLVREALGPLVKGRTSEEILRLRVLDPAMGSGAFLVAACRFLADAYASARELEGDAAAQSPAAQAQHRRLVAQRCLFGVDLNPAAVQLARLSLWLATLAADAPLTFLDHHLRVGDSLLGASFADLMRGWRRATRARSRHQDTGSVLPLFDEREIAALVRGVMPVRTGLQGPDDSVDEVTSKERALKSSLTDGALARWLAAADAWCAWWVWPDGNGPAPPARAWSEISDALVRGRFLLDAALVERWIAALRAAAAGRRFVHWTLHFPEVFFDASGESLHNPGFDAVVGNPPWDMVRGDSCESDARDGSRREARTLMRIVRDSGVYERRTGGHVNRYQLFLERSLSLLRAGGRLGMVCPWGLASDHASAPLRRRLLEHCDVDSLVTFENTNRVFPIHRSVRFLLLTATVSGPTRAIRCVFGMKDPNALDRLSAAAPGWRSGDTGSPAPRVGRSARHSARPICHGAGDPCALARGVARGDRRTRLGREVRPRIERDRRSGPVPHPGTGRSRDRREAHRAVRASAGRSGPLRPVLAACASAPALSGCRTRSARLP
jgi:N-6 DNA Methylase/Eco57I restriction-modification methylase